MVRGLRCPRASTPLNPALLHPDKVHTVPGAGEESAKGDIDCIELALEAKMVKQTK